jgi:hypothetical protein
MKELIKFLLHFPIGFIGICKNKLIELNLNMISKDTFFSYLIVLSLITFIIYQYLYIDVIYCDSMSDSTNNSSENNVGCFSHWDKYKDGGKRKLLWYMWDRYKEGYSSYNEYKSQWDPSTKIRGILKDDIKAGLDKFYLVKRTFSWFFKPSKPGGGRGL